MRIRSGWRLGEVPMSTLNKTYPNSVDWCVTVFAVGLVIALVVAFGYRTVAIKKE